MKDFLQISANKRFGTFILVVFLMGRTSAFSQAAEPPDVLMEKAIAAGDQAVVVELLNGGYPIEARPITPLFLATQFDKIDLVKLFVEKYGANVNTGSGYGSGGLLPIDNAAHAGNLECVLYLLSKGADVKEKSRKDEMAVIWSALAPEKIEILRALIQHGASPSILNNDNETTLYKALYYPSNSIVVGELLKYDIDINKASSRIKDNILHCIAKTNDWRSLDLIAEKHAIPADLISAINSAGFTPLHEASMYTSVEVAERLLKMGADIEARTQKGMFEVTYDLSPLMVALLNVQRLNRDRVTEYINLLLLNGANPDAVGFRGRTPLMFASAYRLSPEPLREMLKAGKRNLEHGEESGATALCWAAINSYENTKLLIEYGADMNAMTGKDHTTPLAYALANSGWQNRAFYESVIELFLVSGVDLSIRPGMDYTYIEMAERFGTDRVREMIKKAVKESGKTK